MRDYAKVSPSFWTRGSGRRLRGDADAQVLALYLVTCPAANMIGVYYVPFVAIAHETGLGTDRAMAAMAACERIGFAFYDFGSELVWVPSIARTRDMRARGEAQWNRRTTRAAERRIAAALRSQVIFRDGLVCHLCRGEVLKEDVHVDHVVPLARGGRSILSNLRVSHSTCNRRKGARWLG